MTEETKKTNTTEKKADTAGVKSAAPVTRERKPFKKNVRRRTFKRERIKPEFDSKVIGIRRVTRVVSGGRRFSFSVTLVAGDKKGRVGVGIGKATDTALAIGKAMQNAKKNMVRISTTETMSIAHEVEAKYGSAVIIIYPTKGKAITAGGSVRSVLSLAGMEGVGAKILSRSKNKLNNARATVLALQKLPKTKAVVKKVEKTEKKEEKKVTKKK